MALSRTGKTADLIDITPRSARLCMVVSLLLLRESVGTRPRGFVRQTYAEQVGAVLLAGTTNDGATGGEGGPWGRVRGCRG